MVSNALALFILDLKTTVNISAMVSGVIPGGLKAGYGGLEVLRQGLGTLQPSLQALFSGLKV